MISSTFAKSFRVARELVVFYYFLVIFGFLSRLSKIHQAPPLEVFLSKFGIPKGPFSLPFSNSVLNKYSLNLNFFLNFKVFKNYYVHVLNFGQVSNTK